MADDSDNLMSLQPIRMLELFPVRKIKCLEFDIDKYKKLFEVLKCTFCQQIFNNPTYLKCSHRFCKDCIEKHIRLNDKKSCPICRGELTTKRDSKSDLKLISLISYAFGDASSLQAEIDKIEEEATKNFKFVKTKSGIQMEIKRQRTQSMDNKSKMLESSVRKRLKRQNEDGQKSQQEYKINIFQREKDETETQKIQQQSNQFKKVASQIQIGEKNEESIVEPAPKRQKVKPLTTIKPENLTPNYINTKYKSSKKKKTQIIEIHSEGSNQIDVLKSKEQDKNVSVIQESIEIRTQIIQTNKLSVESRVQNKGQKELGAQTELGQRSQLSFFKNRFKVKDQLIEARKKLKQAYNENYLQKLIKSSSKKLSLKLKLVPQTNSKLPPLQKPQLQISINMKVIQLLGYILRRYNFTPLTAEAHEYVQLSLINKQNCKFVIYDTSLTILELCQKYWKDYKGVSIFNLQNCLNGTANNTKNGFQLYQNSSLLSSLFKQPPKSYPIQIPCKTLYFNIKLTKILTEMTPKK